MTKKLIFSCHRLVCYVVEIGVLCTSIAVYSISQNENPIGIVETCNYKDSNVDVLYSLMKVPGGETNVLYYAGSFNSREVLVHITSSGEHRFAIEKANVDQNIVMPFTEDRSKWVLLKDTKDEKLLHWNWKREIVDFVRRLPRKSALVKPHSKWVYLDDNDILWFVSDYIVEESLCEELKYGDMICTTELYDGSIESECRLRKEALDKRIKILDKNVLTGSLEYASWENIKPIEIVDDTCYKALCIDDEIVAPLEFTWGCNFDDMLPFDEEIAIKEFVRIAHSLKSNKAK